jgi:serine/threonine protein kinase
MSETRKTVLDNRYDVGRTLGSGGMGEVYLAHAADGVAGGGFPPPATVCSGATWR